MTTQVATASAVDQLWDRWPYLSHEQRLKQFREMHTGEKADFFLALASHDQSFICLACPRTSVTSGCAYFRPTMLPT